MTEPGRTEPVVLSPVEMHDFLRSLAALIHTGMPDIPAFECLERSLVPHSASYRRCAQRCLALVHGGMGLLEAVETVLGVQVDAGLPVARALGQAASRYPQGGHGSMARARGVTIVVVLGLAGLGLCIATVTGRLNGRRKTRA